MRRTEQTLLATGLTLLLAWAGVRFYSLGSSRAAIEKFQANERAGATGEVHSSSAVDFRLWSNERISAYQKSLTEFTATPLAILRIQTIGLVVPIFDGTDDLTLDRGVGRIIGTSQLGHSGNLGVAGHRDGFFRSLGELSIGDIVEVERPGHVDHYVVSETRIVTPDDVSVLKPTASPTLTLVTCFPFHFVGHAPKRYIVTAILDAPRYRDFATEKYAFSHVTAAKR